MFLEQAGFDLKNLKPLDKVVPVNPTKVHVPLNEQGNRITNGYTAAAGQIPWQAGLIIDNTYFCSGSLISSQWVLTAAHCVYG